MRLMDWILRRHPPPQQRDIEEDPNTMERARIDTARVVARGERAADSLDGHKERNHIADKLEALWSGRVWSDGA